MRQPLVLLLALAPWSAALADAPPAAPPVAGATLRHCSLNGRWCVEWQFVDAASGLAPTARVFAAGRGGRGGASWSAPMRIVGWPAVSNDGACVVDMATGSHLLPSDAAPDDPAFVFYCRGRSAWSLALAKLIVDFESLPRSTDRRVWARNFGLDAGDRLVVFSTEGREFLIDPRSGELLRGRYAR